MTAQQLRTVIGVVPRAKAEQVRWQGEASPPTFHIVHNSDPSEVVDVFCDGSKQVYATVQPGGHVYVGTYTFHTWRFTSREDGRMLGTYRGSSATITVAANRFCAERNAATVDAAPAGACTMSTPAGTFAVRGHACGMPIWAFECVADEAVTRAAHVTAQVLSGCPQSVLQAMLAHRPSLAVFGRKQAVTDVPAHAFMRFNTDRDLAASSRGLGATPTVPVTSCAEENLLMMDDRIYPCQSVLVHELGHAVQNLGLSPALAAQVQAAYTAAVKDCLYQPRGCYAVSNELEYWAAGTEAWFESTIRVDVNGGVNTRTKVLETDPRLAALLAQVYGDLPWRFHHDCPRPLSFRPTLSSKTLQSKPAVCQETGAQQPAAAPSPVVIDLTADRAPPTAQGGAAGGALAHTGDSGCGAWLCPPLVAPAPARHGSLSGSKRSSAEREHTAQAHSDEVVTILSGGMLSSSCQGAASAAREADSPPMQEAPVGMLGRLHTLLGLGSCLPDTAMGAAAGLRLKKSKHTA